MMQLAGAAAALHSADLARRHGYVSNLIGLIVEATGLEAEVGEVCLIAADRGAPPVAAEVVGFREGRTLLMPLGEMHGIGPGTKRVGNGRPVSHRRRGPVCSDGSSTGWARRWTSGIHRCAAPHPAPPSPPRRAR